MGNIDYEYLDNSQDRQEKEREDSQTDQLLTLLISTTLQSGRMHYGWNWSSYFYPAKKFTAIQC